MLGWGADQGKSTHAQYNYCIFSSLELTDSLQPVHLHLQVPSRWRNRVADTLLPDLAEHCQPPILMQLHEHRLAHK